MGIFQYSSLLIWIWPREYRSLAKITRNEE